MFTATVGTREHVLQQCRKYLSGSLQEKILPDDCLKKEQIAVSSAANVQADMYELYSALGFSDVEGSTVRKALTQLSPDAYGNAALAAFDMQRMLSDTLLSGLFAHSEQKDSEWHVFVQLYAVTSDMNMPGGTRGYHTTNTGLRAGTVWQVTPGTTVVMRSELGL